MSKLREHALNHTPRCLCEVRATPVPPIEDREANVVAFRLSYSTFGQGGEVHGFDLRDYNLDYGGPAVFISPLAIKWPNGTSTIIFDSNLHGYHGEMQGSAKLRGEGEAKAFRCPHCGGKMFTVSVQFDYWEACDELWEDEPEIKIEDYFCNIIVEGECVTCGHASRILDMDL